MQLDITTQLQDRVSSKCHMFFYVFPLFASLSLSRFRWIESSDFVFSKLQDPVAPWKGKAKGKGKKGKHGKGQAQSPSPQESQAEEAAEGTALNDQSVSQNTSAMSQYDMKP